MDEPSSEDVVLARGESGDVVPPSRRTRVVILLIAIALGVTIWLWVVALDLSRNFAQFRIVSVFPALSCATSAAALAALWPRLWGLVATGLSAPAVVINVSWFAVVLLEGSGVEWRYLYTPALMVASAFGGAACGACSRRDVRASFAVISGVALWIVAIAELRPQGPSNDPGDSPFQLISCAVLVALPPIGVGLSVSGLRAPDPWTRRMSGVGLALNLLPWAVIVLVIVVAKLVGSR